MKINVRTINPIKTYKIKMNKPIAKRFTDNYNLKLKQKY